MDILTYNRKAWDQQVSQGNQWTQPVDHDQIELARQGDWEIILTPVKAVPRSWYPDFRGKPVLCLASGGGQQAPILAAAGGLVTTLDNSPRQLAQDQLVAEREGLTINTIEGDMRDLSMFPDNHFNLIFHPVSNIFIPNLDPVWREAYRVLQPGGVLMSGIANPVNYIFDMDKIDNEHVLEVRYKLPYSDLNDLPKETLARNIAAGYPLEFSHTLDEQIGGQLNAGFVLTGFYEDRHPGELLDAFYPMFMATRALKPENS
ncbi:MAG: SAM-dependent methyltransferase [Chloroflexi bacterium HGW-Chloroflexi-10]|nr:MAG: SAM-dependent methyltransferase [Chloroflexi bacterium HGW-Chloroflexi-10]